MIILDIYQFVNGVKTMRSVTRQYNQAINYQIERIEDKEYKYNFQNEKFTSLKLTKYF